MVDFWKLLENLHITPIYLKASVKSYLRKELRYYNYKKAGLRYLRLSCIYMRLTQIICWRTFILCTWCVESEGPLNREGTDWSYLNTILTIRQTSREPILWVVMKLFVSLIKARLADSKTLLLTLLAARKLLNWTQQMLCWQYRKPFSMNNGSNTSKWKSWRLIEFDLMKDT